MAERERIGMSEEEVESFLRGNRRLYLGLLVEGGAPTAGLAGYLLEDRTVYFAVERDGPAHRQLREDDRVCGIVEQGPSYFEIKSVVVHGRAQEEDESARRARILEAIAGQGVDPAGLALFRLPLGDHFSFDFGKIQRRY
jgi:nitroimidazol reductase NimA-like FMN-containing flavoprotein (pyridoxamine 5'-phosphate oxidase superfamily)